MSVIELIDAEASARFLRLRPGTALCPEDFLLPLARARRALLNRVVHPAGAVLGDERVYLGARLRQRLADAPQPIFVRVDDYPRADLPTRRFFDFARILADQGVQFLLGVTPLLPRGRMAGMTDEEVAWLDGAVRRGEVHLATHGTTHRNLREGQGRHATTELVGVLPQILRRSVREGLEAFARSGLPRPLHYIPPFNSVDGAACAVLGATYEFVHGGPLSIDTLGPVAPGTVVAGTVYLPSYRPWYGRARELLFRAERHRPWSNTPSREGWRAEASPPPARFPLVLTLHWAWEQEDGMKALRVLARTLSGRTGRWELLDEAAVRRSAPALVEPRTAAE